MHAYYTLFTYKCWQRNTSLIAMQHACVVRCFAFEEDEEFVYLALERCQQTLAHLLASAQPAEHQLVGHDGYPTAWCMQVSHVHELYTSSDCVCATYTCSVLCAAFRFCPVTQLPETVVLNKSLNTRHASKS